MKARLFFLSLITILSSVYCSAQEKVVPEPVLEGLRQQMKQIETLKADYTVNEVSGRYEKQLQYEVSYIKSGDKYYMSEYTYEDDKQVEENKYVYNGIDIKFFNYSKKFNLKTGSVHYKGFNDVLNIQNDICGFSGFNIIRPDYERNFDRNVYKNMGKEMIDGHECEKILSIMPYMPSKDAYIYHWIEVRGNKYFLIKNVCIIEDDPGKLLYRKRFDYNYSDQYPIPRTIDYERFDIDNNVNHTPKYKKSIIIKHSEVNVPVAESEFVYFFPEDTIVDTSSASINPETLVDPNRASKTTPLQSVTEVNQPALDNRTEFPIEGGCGVILIPVHIQGKEYSFMVDTGTSNNILDASLKDFLGKPTKMLKVQTAGNPMVMQMLESPLIEIGPFDIPKGSDVACVDMSMFSMVNGRQIDGILGMDFLKNHVILMDFDKGVFSFLVHDNLNVSDTAHIFSLRGNSYGLPQVTGQLSDGIEDEFIIDSGNNYFGELDREAFNRLAAQKDTKTTEILVVAASGSQKKHEMRVKNLKIGNYNYKDIIFGEGNYNCLGIEFLVRHIVTIDFPNMKMYLNASGQFEKSDEDDMSGLHLLLISGKIVVHSVDKDSPADKNGITSGDIILQVKGKDIGNLGISQVRSILKSGDGEKVTLTIGHDSQSKEVTLVLERKI